jgi:rod shape determining protein RodA
MLVVGFLLVYSATLRTGMALSFVLKQGFGILLGAFLLLIVSAVDYRIYRQYYAQIYFISLAALLGVLLFGKTYRGTRGWIDLGYFAFQPVELTKILFITSLAGYLDKNSKELFRWQKLVIPVLMMLGNAALILLQPDFSSTLVYFPVFLAMCYTAGASALHLSAIILFGFVAVSFPLARTLLITSGNSFVYGILSYQWQLFAALGGLAALVVFLWWFINRWRIRVPFFYFAMVFLIIGGAVASSYFVGKSIKDYQKKRLVAFINPNVDSLGAGYNIIQSQIAVGSGRIFGKGIFAGTQAQLGFVPAQHTDFIFSLIGEELGFFFSFLLIAAYTLFVWRAFNVAHESREKYGAIVAVGIAGMFAFYGVLNIGMVVGLAPITGLPLPFLSYGGSSIVMSLVSVGILISIYIRRFRY